jgi:hypothetical protein
VWNLLVKDEWSGVLGQDNGVKKERESGEETVEQGVGNVVENRYLLTNAWHQAVAVDDVVERRGISYLQRNDEGGE